jgi:hypothetical protein
MKNNIKILYGLYFIILVFIFNVKIGHATELIDLQTGSSISSNSDYLFYQGFTPNVNNLTKILLACYAPSTTAGIYDVKIYKGTINTGSYIAMASTTVQNCNTSHTITVNFSPTVELYENELYYLTLSERNGGTFDTNLTNYSVAIGGEFYYASPTLTIDADKTIGAFKTYYDSTYQWRTQVNAYSPSDGTVYATSTVNFTGTWWISNSDLANNINTLVIQADNNDNNTFELIDVFSVYTNSGSFSRYKPLIDGDYTWYGYFMGDNGEQIGTSTFNTFEVMVMSTNATSTCLFDLTECNDTDPLDFYNSIICGLKKFSTWAICPPQWSINSLSNSYNDLKRSFPFNAFFDLTDTVSNAIATTTTNMNGTFSIPFATATGTFYMLPVISSSSMPSAIGQSNTTMIRNTITYIFWALAGFIIFITIKKI